MFEDVKIDPPTTAALERTIGADGSPIRGGAPTNYKVRIESRWYRVRHAGGWRYTVGDLYDLNWASFQRYVRECWAKRP